MEFKPMALVPYLSESDLAEADRPLLARPINLFRALANSPDGLRHFSVLGQWIRHGCELDPRLRELAILQVGHLTASPYEFSHHVKIGYDFGVSDDDITAVLAATAGREHGLGPVETAVLTAAREITTDGRMAEATWATLEEHLGRARLVDLVIIISFYNAVIRILGTLQIDVEPDYERYLEAFPLPDQPPVRTAAGGRAAGEASGNGHRESAG
jgi:alkylhydroperoxidase family enzyme